MIAARRADQAALLATLLFARGTPMLAMGSEMGQSQGGNNNAYAQDSRVAWLDWDAADRELLGQARAMIAARRDLPALRADHFLTGAGDPPDVEWRRADGMLMTQADWDAPGTTTLVVVFAAEGQRVAVALHRGHQAQPLVLPPGGVLAAGGWGDDVATALSLGVRRGTDRPAQPSLLIQSSCRHQPGMVLPYSGSTSMQADPNGHHQRHPAYDHLPQPFGGIMQHLKATKRPVILTVNGKAGRGRAGCRSLSTPSGPGGGCQRRRGHQAGS